MLLVTFFYLFLDCNHVLMKTFIRIEETYGLKILGHVSQLAAYALFAFSVQYMSKYTPGGCLINKPQTYLLVGRYTAMLKQ